jgi:hypothetical protein
MAAYVTSGRAQWRVLLMTNLAVAAVLSVAACSKLGLGGSDEMGWARTALERNDRIEVVAADPATNTFTVRVKETGDLRMVRADQVVAGPPGLASGPATAPAAAPAGAAGSSGSAASDGATPAANPASTATPGERATAANGVPASGQVVPPDTDAVAQAPANSPGTRQSNSVSQPRQRTSADQAASAPRTGFRPDPAPRAEAPDPTGDVASITPGGRVLESGPGYAIKTASRSAQTPQRAEREGSATTSAAVERRHDPIICQGDRLLHIDNRNLEFDGDAVSAEDGCEIHITNSHITAKGVGVSARAANVHIDNSQIEGDSASIDASDGAQVYASSSTFKGMSRRLDNSSFHDLGGNVWN